MGTITGLQKVRAIRLHKAYVAIEKKGTWLMTEDCRELSRITSRIYAAVPNTVELLDTNLLFSQDKSLSQNCVCVSCSVVSDSL